MAPVTRNDYRSFMNSGTRTAKLATTRRDSRGLAVELVDEIGASGHLDRAVQLLTEALIGRSCWPIISDCSALITQTLSAPGICLGS